MVIKSLHTYLCRLSLGSSWAGPFLLCRGSAYSFDSTPQGSTHFLLQPLAAEAVKKQILVSTVVHHSPPPRLLYMVMGPGRTQGFHFPWLCSVSFLIQFPREENEVLLKTHACDVPDTRGPIPQRECCHMVLVVFSTIHTRTFPDRLPIPYLSQLLRSHLPTLRRKSHTSSHN